MYGIIVDQKKMYGIINLNQYRLYEKIKIYKMFLGISSIFLVTNNSISLVTFMLY